jgi:crotonobetainyl-CoA:carnitine CoA-transferase CaiB-like acyl-CoA transferase
VGLFKRLLAASDVVLENFSPRVMTNFGLNYAVLRGIKPSIIMCSMPGYGLTGPQKDYVSYGVNLDFSSGLASLMGYPGEGPHMSGNAYPDAAAALHAVGSVLTALFHKGRTGEGQHIDLSQAESAVSLIGEIALGFALDGKVPPRRGNRHPVYAPHGCYRCRGEDKWVAVAVSTDVAWEALVGVPGMPERLRDKKFADPPKRQQHHDELDHLIESWTVQHTHHKAMRLLQDAGVPAGAVLDAADLLADEQLRKREFFLKIDHPEAGFREYCSLPIKFSGTPVSPGRPSPLLGQHNTHVLRVILGLSDAEIVRLEENGVIGTQPVD